MNVQHHADGKEKQPQQDGTKRLNICLDFMPIRGVRQHYACHESTKRRRKMEVMHQSRTGEHSEKSDDHEQLAFAKRSEEHTSELQSLMRISYAVFCLKKKNNQNN